MMHTAARRAVWLSSRLTSEAFAGFSPRCRPVNVPSPAAATARPGSVWGRRGGEGVRTAHPQRRSVSTISSDYSTLVDSGAIKRFITFPRYSASFTPPDSGGKWPSPPPTSSPWTS